VIERIYIPTVNRVNNQITYNGLPDSLKEKVVFVVQEWERPQYTYPAQYLVLPPHITLSNYLAIAETRKEIYYAGRNQKYAVLDDDIIFIKRNSKYWKDDISNMQKSRRPATHQEIIDMFELFDTWLDEEGISMCGCGFVENPPSGEEFNIGTTQASVYWLNGPDFSHVLDELPLVEVKTGEDTLFILSLLSRGYANKVSQEYLFDNRSVHNKKIPSAIWGNQTLIATQRDHERIAELFPRYFEVLYQADGSRVPGGFRDAGKTATHWRRAYRDGKSEFLSNSLFDLTN